jgi:TPR repeat protein
VPVDFERAAHYLRLAAKGGDASAMYNLGICYREGKGVARSLADARKWFRRAKKADYDPAAIDACLAEIDARAAESGAALTATLAAREAQRQANLAELVAAACAVELAVTIDEGLAPPCHVGRLLARLGDYEGALLVGHEPSLSALAGAASSRAPVPAFHKAHVLCIDEGEQRWMLEVQLVRDRNRIADTLGDAATLVTAALAKA